MPSRPRPEHSRPNHHHIKSRTHIRRILLRFSVLSVHSVSDLCTLSVNSFSYLPLIYSSPNDSRRENPKRSHRRHARQRRTPPQRHSRNQVRHHLQRKRKTPQARRGRIHPAPANSGQAAERIHRPIYQGQSQRSRRQRNQRARHHRNVSSRRGQRCRNGRRHRQGHLRNRRHFHQTNGRRSKIRQSRPRRQDCRRQSLKRPSPREVILTCFHAANSCATPLPPE